MRVFLSLFQICGIFIEKSFGTGPMRRLRAWRRNCDRWSAHRVWPQLDPCRGTRRFLPNQSLPLPPRLRVLEIRPQMRLLVQRPEPGDRVAHRLCHRCLSNRHLSLSVNLIPLTPHFLHGQWRRNPHSLEFGLSSRRTPPPADDGGTPIPIVYCCSVTGSMTNM